MGHLVLSKLVLDLVALGTHTAGEYYIYRMHIVDMHVQSLLAGNKFDANVAEIVVNLPRHAPPALLYVGDERIT
jgi:hypothetical protein